MKHAMHLALASMASLAVSSQASTVKTFDVGFETSEGYTADACPSGSVAGGAWSGNTDSYVTAGPSGYANGNVLQLDAPSDTALTFTPAAAETTTIEMDVQFVGASEAPATSLTGTQAALYLHKTSGLQVSVAGGPFAAFNENPTVAENTWYKLSITFNYTQGSTTIVLADASGTTLATHTGGILSGATKVNGVDFYGNGLVDNFVGKPETAKQTIPTATDAGSGEQLTTDDIILAGGYITPSFAATSGNDALKFITVTGVIDGEPATRTLRVVNGQRINVDGCGFTSVTKVVAYYGDAVTATAAGDAATAPAVTTEKGTTKVTGSVTAKSGLYYGIVVNGTPTALNDGNPVAPEHHGETLNYEVPVSATPYGVQKFKIVASDDPVTAQ